VINKNLYSIIYLTHLWNRFQEGNNVDMINTVLDEIEKELLKEP